MGLKDLFNKVRMRNNIKKASKPVAAVAYEIEYKLPAGIFSSNTAIMILPGMDFKTELSVSEKFADTIDDFRIKVTMGKADVTDSAVNGRSILVKNVAGRIVVTATLPTHLDPPKDWV